MQNFVVNITAFLPIIESSVEIFTHYVVEVNNESKIKISTPKLLNFIKNEINANKVLSNKYLKFELRFDHYNSSHESCYFAKNSNSHKSVCGRISTCLMSENNIEPLRRSLPYHSELPSNYLADAMDRFTVKIFWDILILTAKHKQASFMSSILSHLQKNISSNIDW